MLDVLNENVIGVLVTTASGKMEGPD